MVKGRAHGGRSEEAMEIGERYRCRLINNIHNRKGV